MKKLIAMAMGTTLLGGCAMKEFSSTPFYSGRKDARAFSTAGRSLALSLRLIFTAPFMLSARLLHQNAGPLPTVNWIFYEK